MKIRIFGSSAELGENAADYCAGILNDSIREKGTARMLVSTGASQFETLSALSKKDVNWSKVEMFHLDEYIGLPITHMASFRKYLQERFISKVNLKRVHLVDGEGDFMSTIKRLSDEVTEAPIDLGIIGIGENAHIAFNDPPADFETDEPYIAVTLDDDCKKQQVREGWFPDLESVPVQAISMSPRQIMKCVRIASCVPYEVKAKAIKRTLENDTTPLIPATLLKEHKNIVLFLDMESSSLVDKAVLNRFV